MFGVADLVTYVDVGVLLLLISAVEHSKLPIARAVRIARRIGAHRIARWNRGRRHSRLPRSCKLKAPHSDDDGPALWIWAPA